MIAYIPPTVVTVQQVKLHSEDYPDGAQLRDPWQRCMQEVEKLFTERAADDMKEISGRTFALEQENDGLRIALLVRINLKANENPKGEAIPFEAEILQYDNEHKIDCGWISMNAKIALSRIKELIAWFDARGLELAA